MSGLEAEIKAIKFALASFARYSTEGERVDFLRTNLEQVPCLDIYVQTSRERLETMLIQLRDAKKEKRKRKRQGAIQDDYPAKKPMLSQETIKFHIENDDGIEWLILDTKLNPFIRRYGKIPNKILVRQCYKELFDIATRLMMDEVNYESAMLFTGVPGIGKSLFLIYFVCMLSTHEVLKNEKFALEFTQGNYFYFEPTNSQEHENGRCYTYSELSRKEFTKEQVIIFSDIKELKEPEMYGKFTFIFSSPNKARYKETMKTTASTYFTMPTWSEAELRGLAGQNYEIDSDEWYDRFIKVGGVPRIVFSTHHNPLFAFNTALKEKGFEVADAFFKHGFGNTDDETSYLLTHINPPRDEDSTWDYTADYVYTFASDFVFENIVSKHRIGMLAAACNLFNAGSDTAIKTIGASSAGHAFEKICLLLDPIAGKSISLDKCKALASGPRPLPRPLTEDLTDLTFPRRKLLDSNWENSGLSRGHFYQPQRSNMESADAFCLLPTKDGRGYVLVVIQITVATIHPLKVNGLKVIYESFKKKYREKIVRKIVLFVTPVGCKFDKIQPYHTQKKTKAINIPNCIKDFEQFVYHHRLTDVNSA